MANFSYYALTRQGVEVRGQVQADDINAAQQDLRQQGFNVMELKPKREGSIFFGQANFSDWLASQRSVSSSALIFFFRQMAFMLKAGLAVAQALELAEAQVASARLNLTLRIMLKDIEAGQSLSLAMKKHPAVFSDMMVNLVVAGETTGDLSSIMERLAIHLDKKSALRAQMTNAMIYPCIVVFAAIGVGVFMVVKIIPQFAKFLSGKGKVLPPSTQMLIDISDAIRSHGVLIIGVLIAFILFILICYQTRIGRLVTDNVLLRVPVMGNMLVTGSMAQLSWGLSILLRSGVPVFEAMKVTSHLLNNKVYANQLMVCSDKIWQGKDIARSLDHPKIPPLVVHMIAVGEKTGSLDNILEELGVYYESLLAVAIKRLSAMIEPAMILVIGGMVGFVYYAFFQALFSLVN
ncbi:MAG: type II secretion system F family protein [Methyloprofundus sp.]|nr:type II secretion system F family protein [Methyloprofundus sp.]